MIEYIIRRKGVRVRLASDDDMNYVLSINDEEGTLSVSRRISYDELADYVFNRNDFKSIRKIARGTVRAFLKNYTWVSDEFKKYLIDAADMLLNGVVMPKC